MGPTRAGENVNITAALRSRSSKKPDLDVPSEPQFPPRNPPQGPAHTCPHRDTCPDGRGRVVQENRNLPAAHTPPAARGSAAVASMPGSLRSIRGTKHVFDDNTAVKGEERDTEVGGVAPRLSDVHRSPVRLDPARSSRERAGGNGGGGGGNP